MKSKKCLALGLAAALALFSALVRADAVPPGGAGESRSWRTEPRHSAGIAPDPVEQAALAIVQVYSAATYGWRGLFAEHPWIIYKRSGETAFTRGRGHMRVVARSRQRIGAVTCRRPDFWQGRGCPFRAGTTAFAEASACRE
jgi:hypothetical protein